MRSLDFPPMNPKTRLAGHTLAIATLAVASVVLTWPLVLHPASTLTIFWGDPVLNAYILAWGQHALLHDPLNAFNANFLHPMENTIALSENLLGVALLGLPLAPFKNPLLTYNVMMLLSFFLSGAAWYAVLRNWGLNGLAAWTGGYIFAFMPWRFGQLGHAQLLYTWWIPVVLWLVERWTRTGGWKYATGAALAFSASFYSTVYGTFFLGLFLIPFAAVGLWRPRSPQELRRMVVQAIGAAAIAAMVLAPALAAYFNIKKTLGDPNSMELVQKRGAAVSDYLRAPGTNWLWGQRRAVEINTHSDVPWEHELFPGFSAAGMALSLVPALLIRRRRIRMTGSGAPDEPALSRIALMLAAGGLWLFVISLGPRLYWRGEVTDIDLPFGFLFEHLPGTRSIRVPARAGMMVGFALGGLAAVAVHCWWAAPGRYRIAGRAGCVACIAFLLAEFIHTPLPLEGNPDYARHLRIEEKIGDKQRGPILVLPLDDLLNYLVPLTTAPHFYPTLNGVTGYLPGVNSTIFQRFREPAWGAKQKELLRWLRVRYVVVDRRAPSKEPLPEVESALRDFGFTFEKTEHPKEEITVFKIDPYAGEYEVNQMVTPKKKRTELYIWMTKTGLPMELPPSGRKVRLTGRGYDEKDEQIWKGEVEFLLPQFWLPDYTSGGVLRIPKREASRMRRVKFRLTQDEMGFRNEGELPWSPTP